MALFTRNKGLRESGSEGWEQFKEQSIEDSIAYQDMHGSQQIERSAIEKVISTTPLKIGSAIMAAVLFILTWGLASGTLMGFDTVSTKWMRRSEVPPAYTQTTELETSIWGTCYVPALPDGSADISGGQCYENKEDVPEPAWHAEAAATEKAKWAEQDAAKPQMYWGWFFTFSLMRLMISLSVSLGITGIFYQLFARKIKAQNTLRDHRDINQNKDDQHIAFPEEVRERFDFVPDVGAHTRVSATTLISHSMVSAKGSPKVKQMRRADKDILDEEGFVEVYKGEVLTDDNGEELYDLVPMIDEPFGDELWDASNLPKDKNLRRRLDPTKIPYNPGNGNRDKLKGYDTMIDVIRGDWEYPEYEVQRPAGVYYVDTSPANTMILAMTRAGKGQTYIEPMLDIWTRQIRPDNIVANDPKGELLVKNYVRASMRGFRIVQLNLINVMKTDIYNPLTLASESARDGDQTNCAMYVDNIANVFFPVDGAEDPVWPNAANNAFKRAAFGLIDFYLEKERTLRNYARANNMDPSVLDQKLDEMWGKVTLYNCYQMFVRMTSKKRKSPMTELNERLQSGYYDQFGIEADERYENDKLGAEEMEFLWDGAKELDLLTLYFNATEALPQSTLRGLVSNANNALRSMAGAEKMLASVYGIAITAMSFFTDPTIATLTSGMPSQNIDLGGFSFPRRMGVRLAQNFVTREHMVGLQVKWDAFADPGLKENLGKDFTHDDIISREGWCRYYFDGKFPTDQAYLRLRVINPDTSVLVRTFYFKFIKGYQTSLNGRRLIKDPVTEQNIVMNGTLTEMIMGDDGVLTNGHVVYPDKRLVNTMGITEVKRQDMQAVLATSVNYSEQPKFLFLVTPPHLQSYAKIILIFLTQLVNMNFERSYMTKDSQKPLYKTRYMLDELGNLQSEGNGIAGFETMLSIGLGQEQQFTLILQTLQQLKDVYGDSVDKIVQGNVANIIFLKSTDDTMIETLSKMSGTWHKSVRESKTVTQDLEQVVTATNVEGKVSYTVRTEERAVISYNHMAFLPERNSIVFSAGVSPIWNRNAEILPMSWRLFKDTIIKPGKSYSSLKTVPSLSTAMDFDVRKNQPDFVTMLNERIAQAVAVKSAEEQYRKAHNLDDYGMSMLDPDVVATEIMDLVESNIGIQYDFAQDPHKESYEEAFEDPFALAFESTDYDNEDAIREAEAVQAQLEDAQMIRYAKHLSRADLVNMAGQVFHSLDNDFLEAYRGCQAAMLKDAEHFSGRADGTLMSADGITPYISRISDTESMQAIRQASEDDEGGSRVYAEDGAVDQIENIGTWQVHDAFYHFLAGLNSWSKIAGGQFEDCVSRALARKEAETIL